MSWKISPLPEIIDAMDPLIQHFKKENLKAVISPCPNRGNKYTVTTYNTVTTYTYEHGILWKIGKLMLAIFASLGTCFVGPFISDQIKNLWLKAFSGREIFIVQERTGISSQATREVFGDKKPSNSSNFDVREKEKKDLLEKLPKGYEISKNDGILLIKQASKHFAEDQDIALAFVLANTELFAFIDKRLRGNEVFLLKLFAALKHAKNHRYLSGTGSFLPHVTKEMQANKKVVLGAAAIRSFEIASAEEKLQRDSDVIRSSLKLNGNSLYYLHSLDKKNKEYILLACEQSAGAFQYVEDEELKNDFKLVRNVVQLGSGFQIFQWLGERLIQQLIDNPAQLKELLLELFSHVDKNDYFACKDGREFPEQFMEFCQHIRLGPSVQHLKEDRDVIEAMLKRGGSREKLLTLVGENSSLKSFIENYS